MKNIGLHLDGLLFKKAEIDASGKPICLYDCGFLAGPLQDGMLAQFGEDSFSTLKSEILPGGSPTLCLRKKSEFSKFILPPWATWKRIRLTEPKNRKWSCQSSLGGSVEIDLEEHLGRLIKAEVSSVEGKGALIVDDDLELSVQDRLLRYIGKDIDLLPKSVACVLSHIRGKPNQDLAKLDGKNVLVVSVGMDRTTVTKVTLRWLDKNWRSTDTIVDGFLVPEIEQKEQRVLKSLSYIPMDIYQIASSQDYFPSSEERLSNLWASQISALLKSPMIFWSPKGWHEDFCLTPTNFDKDSAGQIQESLVRKREREHFNLQNLKEHLKESVESSTDLILISNDSYGFLKDELLSDLQKDFDVDIKQLVEEISTGALDFLTKKDAKNPTYRERLPDIYIEGQLPHTPPEWFHLVNSIKDFAKGGIPHQEDLPFSGEIESNKENILFNLRMGKEQIRLQFKHAYLTFNKAYPVKIRFRINVKIQASQGYGKVTLCPILNEEEIDWAKNILSRSSNGEALNERDFKKANEILLCEEFRRVNGEILLDWQTLQSGHEVPTSGYEAPGYSEIEPLKYDYARRYSYIEESLKELININQNDIPTHKLKELLVSPTGIHPNMRNGLTLGSNPKEGIKSLIQQGWSDGSNVLNYLKCLNKRLRTLWSDNIDDENIKDWICRVASHMWKDTDPVFINYLSKIILRQLRVQYVEAAGRCFRDKDSISVFVDRFWQVGFERLNEETLQMQHWFKAFYFILRTRENVHQIIDKHHQVISRVFKKQILSEWIRFRNEIAFEQKLSIPLRQTLLSSLYILNLRKFDSQLFDFNLSNQERPDQEFVFTLYRVVFESWSKMPWVHAGGGLPDAYYPVRSRAPKPIFLYLFLWLWDNKHKYYPEDYLRNKFSEFILLYPVNCEKNLEDILKSFESEGIVSKSSERKDTWEIGTLPERWNESYRTDEGERDSVQSVIGRFLQKKANESDITIIEELGGTFADD